MLSPEERFRRKRQLACRFWRMNPAQLDAAADAGEITPADVEDLVLLLCADPATMWVATFLYADELEQYQRQRAQDRLDAENQQQFVALLARAKPEDERSAVRLAELRAEFGLEE